MMARSTMHTLLLCALVHFAVGTPCQQVITVYSTVTAGVEATSYPVVEPTVYPVDIDTKPAVPIVKGTDYPIDINTKPAVPIVKTADYPIKVDTTPVVPIVKSKSPEIDIDTTLAAPVVKSTAPAIKIHTTSTSHSIPAVSYTHAANCGSAVPSHPAAALPPVVKSNGQAVEINITYPWQIRRDGGGGGTISCKHVINFADTTTKNERAMKSYGFYPFVSNSIVTAEADGITVTDYGTTTDYGAGWVKQQWTFASKKNPLFGDTSEMAPTNHRYAVWPNTNIVTGCDGECGYTVSNVMDINLLPDEYSETFLYSTLSKITLGPDGPKVDRLTRSLWYAYEINYGCFGLARATDGSNDILMFAAPLKSFGVKVARVAEADIADKSKYTFWDGSKWASDPPSVIDADSNIFNYNVGGYGVGTGDIFYSEYYKTWVAVFNDGMTANSIFRLMYSTSGDVTGPWCTEPIDLYTAPSCDGTNDSHNGNVKCSTTYNYGTHAYPNIDPTGKTLLLGWTYNGHITMFSTVEFQ